MVAKNCVTSVSPIMTHSYESSNAFCVAFKRTYGMTPMTARKTHTSLPPYDCISFTLSITYIKGTGRMSKSGNLLSAIHYLIDKNQGQHYVFNGCMAYLMESLGESKDYDYCFFSGVSGDCYTQVCWITICFSLVNNKQIAVYGWKAFSKSNILIVNNLIMYLFYASVCY